MPKSNPISLIQYKTNIDNLQFHLHNDYEILYITEGIIELTVGKSVITAKKGDVVFLNVFELHKTKVIKEPYKRYVMIISSDILEKNIYDIELLEIFKNRTANYDFCVHFNETKDIENLISLMIKEVKTDFPDIYSKRLQFQWIEQLLVFATRNKNKLNSTKSAEANSIKNIVDIQNYMSKHYSENLKISDISKKLFVSPQYFSTFFKSHIGVSPKKYLIQLRIDSAAYKLINTDDSIISIAFSVGFSDINNFTRKFKEFQQMTPSEFRKKYTKTK